MSQSQIKATFDSILTECVAVVASCLEGRNFMMLK